MPMLFPISRTITPKTFTLVGFVSANSKYEGLIPDMWNHDHKPVPLAALLSPGDKLDTSFLDISRAKIFANKAGYIAFELSGYPANPGDPKEPGYGSPIFRTYLLKPVENSPGAAK